jgi:hypothetical protein
VTNYPREVVELCLSHVQGDALERAYQRGDILDKRRRLMQEWADYCQHGDQQQADNVVAIRALAQPRRSDVLRLSHQR